MEHLQQLFGPHQFGPNEPYIDLYHVYDNLSRTPFQRGIGIQCGDPDNYSMVNTWHVITPSAMRDHLNWRNWTPTQFVSFYDNPADAQRERLRRIAQPHVYGVTRNTGTVSVAHVRISWETNVWSFSRNEMLAMMGYFDDGACLEMFRTSGVSEWFVWGGVPEALVQNRHELWSSLKRASFSSRGIPMNVWKAMQRFVSVGKANMEEKPVLRS